MTSNDNARALFAVQKSRSGTPRVNPVQDELNYCEPTVVPCKSGRKGRAEDVHRWNEAVSASVANIRQWHFYHFRVLISLVFPGPQVT